MTIKAVETKNLFMEFQTGDVKTRVLHGIDFELNYGSLTMLVGPSGCGKTTLLSIITGILTQSEGDVRVNGIHLNKLTDDKKVLFRRRELGFIFQKYNLLPALTAAENAAIPLVAAGQPFEDAVNKARKILSNIGLTAQTERLPSQLSGGQQQRVAIARALVHNPRLIVCDEPTAALDEQTGQTVMEILSQHAVDPNRAVVVVTHDNRIYKFADRIVQMNDGRIVGSLEQRKK